MNKENAIEIINFFNRAPVDTKHMIDFGYLNEKAVKLGYVIHPDCCNEFVESWLKTLTENYNATFYKEWNDIITKDRFELFIDQLVHYATTYGTDFSIGNGYVPNEGSIQPDFKVLKVIEPITDDELYVKCLSVVKSGIALSEKTMKVVCDFIADYYKINGIKKSFILDLNMIKNKEAQVYLSIKLNEYPEDEFGILRCLVYQYTESLLLIKNRSTIGKIKNKAIDFDSLIDMNHPIMRLTDDNIDRLSRIFYRFKPIFLAMKTKKTASVINKLRRLAKKNHTPLQPGFWETVVSIKKPVSEIKKRIDELDNFRKVRILQAINVALYSLEKSKVYTIRNGKVFTKCDYAPKYDKAYLNVISSVFEDSLVKSLSKKACKVRFSPYLSMTLPSTEKSFVGNYPFGSSINFDGNAVVGIYWRNEWGTHDYDLSFVGMNGERVGWNSSYYKNADVIYSGDMTNADPEAVETMFIRNRCSDSVVYVNQFNGNTKSKFRLFFAKEDMNPAKIRNRMVDPNNIRLDTMIDIDDERQKTVGVIHDNVFYFMDLHSGNSIVSSYSKYGQEFIKTMCARTVCYVDLKSILLKAGYIEVEDGEEPDIDFMNPEKDSIIKLMSNE